MRMHWTHKLLLHVLTMPCLCFAGAATDAVSPALAQASVQAPRSPSGQVLMDWLDAFNSGDRARLDSFSQAYSWGAHAENLARWQAEVDGYELLKIYASDESHILFRLRSRTDGQEEIGRIRLKSIAPTVIVQLGAYPVPAGSRFDLVKIDNVLRRRLLGSIARMLTEGYVYPEVGRKMAADLRRREVRREFHAIRDGSELAAKLTGDLQEISGDRHLALRFSDVVVPAGMSTPDIAKETERVARANCGFIRVEHLQPNTGYVKFDGFENATLCGPTASAAMNFIADSNALIIDLRDNHGGGGGMPEFIASYLFADRTHLDDLYSRTTGQTTEIWTSPDVPGRKFVDKPVYLLTSKGTFSAAEYFANVLRNLRGATLIGETTGGGAHTTDTRRVDDHFTMRLPSGRPVTRTDWEGTGLEPDMKVPAAEALESALTLAAKRRP